MKLAIFTVLSALVSFAGAWTIWDDGRINSFFWPQDAKDLPTFSARQNVSFVASYFGYFSKTIGEQLTNVKNLTFLSSYVSSVYLKQDIHKLFIFRSQTENIEIDPDKEYALVKLFVSFCELTYIPRNIKLLKRLKELSLKGNYIEYVKMSDFNDLINLEILSLDVNKIKTLSSESTIHLPKLHSIGLAINNLTEINVCSWDMPSLKTLDLHNNKLKFVVNLVDQFPKLSEIDINENPLVCSWKDNLVRSLKRKNTALKNGVASCDATVETPVPKECPEVYSLSNRSSDVSQRSWTNRIESLEQMMEQLYNDNQSLKQTVATLTDRLQQVEKKSN